jgi:hypothetical protein
MGTQKFSVEKWKPLLKKTASEPGVVAQVYNPRRCITQEAAGG